MTAKLCEVERDGVAAEVVEVAEIVAADTAVVELAPLHRRQMARVGRGPRLKR